MAKDKTPKDETATPKIKIRQQAKVVNNIDGPVTIVGIHAYDAAGKKVAQVGIDKTKEK